MLIVCIYVLGDEDEDEMKLDRLSSVVGPFEANENNTRTRVKLHG